MSATPADTDGPSINLNLTVRGLKASATVSINELSNQLIRSGRRVHKLGLGQSPFPVPEQVVAALRHNAHQSFLGAFTTTTGIK